MLEVKAQGMNEQGESSYSLGLAVDYTCQINGINPDEVMVVGNNTQGYLVFKTTETTKKVTGWVQENMAENESAAHLMETYGCPNQYIINGSEKVPTENVEFYTEVSTNLLAEFYEVTEQDGVVMLTGEGVWVHRNKGKVNHSVLYGEDMYAKFDEMYEKETK